MEQPQESVVNGFAATANPKDQPSTDKLLRHCAPLLDALRLRALAGELNAQELLLKAHTSNYQVQDFTAAVDEAELPQPVIGRMAGDQLWLAPRCLEDATPLSRQLPALQEALA